MRPMGYEAYYLSFDVRVQSISKQTVIARPMTPSIRCVMLISVEVTISKADF